MSRSEYPPGYNEAPGPPYAPPAGGYPPPPSYGFPSFDGMQPGQPSAPYPVSSNTPLYPGQPMGYPSGPYPGQPHPGGPPGSGYPRPPPMPVIPPIMPAGMLNSDDTENNFAESGRSFDDLSIRHAFIRKVYLILTSQLLLTTAIVAVFTFVDSVKLFVQRNTAVYWVSYAVYVIVHLVLVCCKGPRRKFPWNVILLLLYISSGCRSRQHTTRKYGGVGCYDYSKQPIQTLALSYTTGTISSFYDTKAVFLALGITAIVCIAVTVFCFQTKVDFTKCQGLFCVLGIVMLVTSIITAIVLSFKYIPWLHMLYAAFGAIVFTLFLAYHTQLLIGNRKHSISPEEYVFAALSLYVDIVQIFLFLLQIIGASSK